MESSTWGPRERLLNEDAQYELLREIHKARREWIEFVSKVVGGVVTAVVSILGAATGLIAVWRR